MTDFDFEGTPVPPVAGVGPRLGSSSISLGGYPRSEEIGFVEVFLKVSENLGG